MNDSLQQILIDRYPDLMNIESGPWGAGMGFTVRVGAAGWFGLIDQFCRQVTREKERFGLACRITRIKEKLGELRILCEGANEQIETLINEVRLESARTCQVCGKYGALHILQGTLAATLCDADAKKLDRPVRWRVPSDL
jgi:hypothetical protein